MLTQQPMPQMPPPQNQPTRGQRVAFQRTATNTLITGQWQTLLRASQQGVNWQVTLSPVFRVGVGPVPEGVPTNAAGTGAPRVRMTFGAGGVTYRYEGAYPVAGASFSLAADDVAVEVAAFDAVTAFANASDVPAVLGWISERTPAQAITPLMAGTIGNAALVGPFAMNPFCRALHVWSADGSAVTVTLTGAIGTITATVASGSRIAVPGGYHRYSAVAAVGDCTVAEELCFA